jgi:hypothetical protein
VIYTATHDNDLDDFLWVRGLSSWPQQPHTGDIELDLVVEIRPVWQRPSNHLLPWPRTSAASNSICSVSSAAPSEPILYAFRSVYQVSL